MLGLGLGLSLGTQSRAGTAPQASLSHASMASATISEVTTEDGSAVTVVWADGYSEEIASGGTATRTYASDTAGVVTLTAPSPITRLSLDGAADKWDFVLADLPNSLVYFWGAGLNTIGGDLADMARTLTDFVCFGFNTIFGDIADASSGLTRFLVAGANTVGGNLEDKAAGTTYFRIEGNNTVTITPAASLAGSTMRYLEIEGAGLSSSEVDNILIACAEISTWTSQQEVRLAGANAPRTAASNDAVATLEGYGVTVYTTDDGVAVQTALVGADTLAGAKSWLVKREDGLPAAGATITGGTASNISIDADGYLSPDSNGDFAAQDGNTVEVDGVAVTLSVAGDTYSVGDITEADAAFTAIGSSGGKTVRFLNGECAGGHGTRLARNLTFSSPVTLTGVAGTVVEGGMSFEDVSGLTIDGLAVHQSGSSSDNVVRLLGTCILTVQDCTIYGDERDPLGDYTSAGAYQNPYGIRTVSDGTSANTSITVKRTLFRDLSRGMALTCRHASGFSIIDNEFLRLYEDGVTMLVEGDGLTASKEFSRNVAREFVGDPADTDNPHIDFFQFLSTASNDGLDLTNFVARQNEAWENQSDARGTGVDGIVAFTDGGYNVVVKDAVICGNDLHLTGNHHVNITAIDGGTYVNNTLTNPTASGTGQAQLKLGSVSSAGNIDARNNVADGYLLEGSATYDTTGNVTLGVGGATIAYATQFDGSTFPGSTFAEVKANWSVASGTAGAIGSGYGVYGDVRDETGWSYDSDYETPPASNLLTNGGFDTDSDWTKGTGWSISGGEAVFAGGASYSQLRQNSVSITGGVEHEAYFSFTEITDNTGNFVLRVQEADGSNSGTQHQANVSIPASPGQITPITFTPAADCTAVDYYLMTTDAAAQFKIDDAYLGET